jgi:hypothetical protein
MVTGSPDVSELGASQAQTQARAAEMWREMVEGWESQMSMASMARTKLAAQ